MHVRIGEKVSIPQQCMEVECDNNGYLLQNV